MTKKPPLLDPITSALYAVLAGMVYVVATLISAPPGTIDPQHGIRALIAFPALAGSFSGMVTAGIVYLAKFMKH